MGILRVFLAITVVMAHSGGVFGVRFAGGLVAVELFFIISGFYMTMILDKKYTGNGSYLLFLSNRFLRLFPMFWIVLLLTVFVCIIFYFTTGSWGLISSYSIYFDLISIKTLIFLIASNIFLFGQDIVMFLGISKESGEMFLTFDFSSTEPKLYTFLLVPQAWSLGIEVMFYLIAPFVVRKSSLFVILIIIISLFVRFITYSLGHMHDPWTYRFFPSELALFLLGTIAYRIYKSRHRIGIFNKRNQYMIATLLFVLLVFYQFIPLRSGYSLHVINWFIYLLACLALPCIFELSKTSTYDSKIGELSYPIYISQALIIFIIAPFITNYKLQEYNGIASVLITIIVSYILVKTIAGPIEKIRQSRIKVTFKA